MNLSVIGTGYVGLVSGACFAEARHKVYCVDSNEQVIAKLNKGIIPIYEPGLAELVLKNSEKERLVFTSEVKVAIENTDVCFIAVGTPSDENGSADLQQVFSVANDIGKYMSHDMIVVDKSTVPPGTAETVREIISSRLSKRGVSFNFSVVSVPEFLKEGSAVDDCIKPERIVIGADTQRSLDIIRKLYVPDFIKDSGIIAMDVKSAEMTKYAANAMLALRISFINEIAAICQNVGADINAVRIGIGSDSRIGASFLYPGCGYGGSCLPKDVRALAFIAEKSGYYPRILSSIESVNCDQKTLLIDKVTARFSNNLKGRTFACWGLAFKPNTDDMREAPSITIIEGLTARGAKIKAYDPKATAMAKNIYLKDNKNVEYAQDMYTALVGADALILITEWNEFRDPDFDKMSQKLKNRIIFDGRNQFSSTNLKNRSFEYYQIGAPDIVCPQSGDDK